MIVAKAANGFESRARKPARRFATTISVESGHELRAEKRRIHTALLQEDLLDRRWARHRDQLLTVSAILAAAASVALGRPELAGAALLAGAPRVAELLIDAALRRSK
jgi:hypothetical protein